MVWKKKYKRPLVMRYSIPKARMILDLEGYEVPSMTRMYQIILGDERIKEYWRNGRKYRQRVHQSSKLLEFWHYQVQGGFDGSRRKIVVTHLGLDRLRKILPRKSVIEQAVRNLLENK